MGLLRKARGGAWRHAAQDDIVREIREARREHSLLRRAGDWQDEFVKHLGKTLNSRVVVKMGSDLLFCWVGETEKNIKRAFEAAESGNAILFPDEIDGIVQDRSGA